MEQSFPVPGDIIVVECSEWYALKHGERLRVCETAGWARPGLDLFVAPRKNVRTFWGPDFGAPDGSKPEHMSTSGGPFFTVAIEELEGLERIGRETDTFWHWKDFPRAGGGVERSVEVTVWKVSVLPSKHYRMMLEYGYVEPVKPPAPSESKEAAKPKINLSCVHCDRTDGQGLETLPDDWTSVHEVQFVLEDDCTATHHGVCPECRDRYERDDIHGSTIPDEDPLDRVDPIVKQVINRDCHVGASNREVIRHVISKLRNGYETFRKMSPADRRTLVQQCVLQHSGNRKEYAEVMSGFSTVPDPESERVYPLKLTGKDVQKLMNRHKVTISNLAFRLGTSMKRIRLIREKGLADPLAVRDWIEAITGEDPGPLPEPYRICQRSEITECSYCGFPLDIGDQAYEYVGEVFCSTSCCRKSRGW